jgi:hypothetical protein
MNCPDATVTIPFSGSPSKQAFLRVQSLLLPAWARWYVFAPGVLYLFVSFGVGWTAAISTPTSALPDLFLTVLFLLASAAITRYLRIKTWRNTMALVGNIHGVITDTGIEWITAHTTSKFEWDKFIKARQETDLSLVFYAERCALYFPRSFFASEQEWQQFREIVRLRVSK